MPAAHQAGFCGREELLDNIAAIEERLADQYESLDVSARNRELMGQEGIEALRMLAGSILETLLRYEEVEAEIRGIAPERWVEDSAEALAAIDKFAGLEQQASVLGVALGPNGVTPPAG